MAHSVRKRHAAVGAATRESHGAPIDPTTSTFDGYGLDMDVTNGVVPITGPDSQGTMPADNYLTPGTLNLGPFSNGVRPVAIVTGGTAGGTSLLMEDGFRLLMEDGFSLLTEAAAAAGDPSDLMPALPDEDYPEGCVVYNTDDGKLYRNIAEAWVRSVDGADLIVDSVTTGSLRAGIIQTVHFAATATIALVSNGGSTVVIDPTGITIRDGKLTFIDQYGSTVLAAGGFSGSWLNFLQFGAYNAGFLSGPPTPLSNVTTGDMSANQIPAWIMSNVSGTGVTFKWTADTSAPQGARVVASIASGAAGDDSMISNWVPVSTSKTRTWTVLPKVTALCSAVGTAGLAKAYIAAQYYKADKTTATGAINTVSATLTAINGSTGNQYDLRCEPNGFGSIPADAAWLRVDVGLKRDVAANAAAGSVSFYEMYPQRGEDSLYLTDTVDPDTYSYTKVQSASGYMSVTSDNGKVAFFKRGDASSWLVMDRLGLAGTTLYLGSGATAADTRLFRSVEGVVGFDNISFIGYIVPTGLGAANVHDWTPSNGATAARKNHTWYISSTAAINLTGISISQVDGERHVLHNGGAFGITLKQLTTSGAANQFDAPDYILSSGGSIEIMYGPAGKWLVLGK